MSKNTNPVKQEAIIFDLDGTITDFRTIDSEIISSMFSSKIVLFLDRVLWRINETDILKNTMLILKIRLFLYSIFSGKSYFKILNNYRREYFFKTYNEFRKKYEVLKSLSKRYVVIILSNNEFSKGVKYQEISTINSSSKYSSILKLMKIYDIKYFVGNNLIDDVLSVKGTNIKSIYVGKNSFVGYFADRHCSISEFLNSVK